ncbi:MAG: serine/threonine-protein kinase [Planctomycetota bacterium]
MEAPSNPTPTPHAKVDWETFYRDYRKPGYLPGFEIVGKLGGGVFGLVFKARKESIGKDYAVKFLKVDDVSVRDAVLREIENVSLFAQVDHPNLVSIEDRGVVDGIPYVVMNYAGQETLQGRLRAGRMPRDEALRWFQQVARGVAALHDHGLVHFDIKPANVFLKGEVARVGDYGLSKLVSESRNTLSFSRGTPYYMAPELLLRRGDARSDVYSLGILLYECLYGAVPFRGESEWEVLKQHETAAPTFPAEARSDDVAVLRRCLEKKPEARFATAGELLAALAATAAPAALGVPAAPAALGALAAAPSAGTSRTAASPLPLPAAAGARDAKDSPYGMPWRQEQPTSPLAWFARGVFTLVEGVFWLAYTPVRVAAFLFGPGLGWLFALPFRILATSAKLLGLLVLFALVVLVVVTIYYGMQPVPWAYLQTR